MSTSETKLQTGQTVTWDNSQLISIYANTMAIGLTPFDLSLTFGEIGYATPEQMQAVGRVKLILAPEQASNLMKLLSIAVQKYVENNGELRVAAAVDPDLFSRTLQENLVKPNQ
ncbi:DUF3467 domain-containing protein [Acidicapsa dinghuensis]|uniref:DUF3467 domain-containing protein n=2 Tax=Acidicapsa dinghuensis TaxID=2218256 RepID=A0ABW1ELW2_9BACT|nr:DUF3467 domain-containing protein [Acidicapsa dinghuensis]